MSIKTILSNLFFSAVIFMLARILYYKTHDFIVYIWSIIPSWFDAVGLFLLVFALTTFFRWLKSSRKEKKGMLSHFSHSYGIIKDKMIPSMKELVSKNEKSPEVNKRIDRYIQPPIEYVNETVKGNQVPEFKPDDTYQDVIFDSDIKFIVAITAENPNLWMDPTLCFYIANCYAVSLINYAKRCKGKDIKIVNYKDLEKVYKKDRGEILDTLKQQKELNRFEFIRFFLYDEEQKECCKSAVFPSLKASQDLFRTFSFYILKERIKKESYWYSFKQLVDSIWGFFGENDSEVLQRRKDNTVPEFLVLFFQDKIEIHTYFDGHHYKNKNEIKTTSPDYNKVMELISQMAKFEIERGDDLDNLPEDMKNLNNAFIDWV